MFTTDSFIDAEVAYRGERIQQDWGGSRAAPVAAPAPLDDEQRHDVGGARHNGRRARRPQRRPHRTRCRAGAADLPARHPCVRWPARRRTRCCSPGDAGVGKTRLLTELRDVALAEGWQVAGRPLPRPRPTGPCPTSPSPRSSGASSRSGPRWPRACPTVTPPSPASSRAAGCAQHRRPRRGTSRSTAATSSTPCTTCSERSPSEGPLLVVVEDAHWADQSTRDMLSFLFSRPFAGPVAPRRVLPLRRPPPPPPAAPPGRGVGAAARASSGSRWSRSATTTCAASSARSTRTRMIARPSIADIVDRAEGNAFFVEELVGATWATGGQVPGELADVLLVRLDRLDDDAPAQVVRVAAVAGRHVSPRAAGRGLRPRRRRARGGAARRRRVPTCWCQSGGGAYAFRHALLGEAVYDDLLPGERTRLHTAFAPGAAVAGSAAGTAAELALHARRAGDRLTAVRAGIEAGNEAFAVGGPHEAADAVPRRPRPARRPARRSPTTSTCTPSCAAAPRRSSPPVACGRAIKVLRAHLASPPGRTPRPPTAARCSPPSPPPCCSPTPPRTREVIAAEAVELLADAPPRLRARALIVHAQTPGPVARGAGPRRRRVEGLALAQRHNLTGLAVEIATTLTSLDETSTPAGRVRPATRRRRATWPTPPSVPAPPGTSTPSCARSTSWAGSTTTAATSTAALEAYGGSSPAARRRA